ncbi:MULTISPECIES: DNA cytosine methyltransferase [unclassified Roseibium]|uniref:DNA cytosine methyltransferase n=1 Tax=unclassified Roseibium TaxID=2629323 RepID=UPI00273ED5B2|nr:MULTISPECIES: DNA cytosine methyltransferase [unclassified Roseibium]
MRVFSTFSGISSASVAWRPFGFEFAAYAEPNPECSWVLHHRLGTGRPKYMPQPDAPDIQVRLGKAAKGLRRAACDHRFKRISNQRLAELSKKDDLDADTKARLEIIKPQLDEFKSVCKEITDRRRVIRRAASIPETGFAQIPNLGDITQITDKDLEELGHVDVLEGGPPCQAFSVAGMRKGLRDERGNLSLAFCQLAERMKEINGTRYIVFENVPGTLHDAENAFGCIMAALAGEPRGELFPPGRTWPNSGHVLGTFGRSIAWRVLDSQFFGVPQRRRRLFAVCDLGGEGARDILFEPKSGPGNCGSVSSPWPGVTSQNVRGVDFDNTHKTEFPTGRQQGTDSSSNITEKGSPTFDTLNSGNNATPVVTAKAEETLRIRRLTPVECERLQGFPDEWTLVPTIDEMQLADLPRYKAIGNSMTASVMAFIGERLMASDCGRLKEVNRRGRTRFEGGYPGNPSARGYSLTGHGLYKEELPLLRASFGDAGGGSEALVVIDTQQTRRST